jgi:myo-inositol-1(or 4)-monophosphatase
VAPRAHTACQVSGPVTTLRVVHADSVLELFHRVADDVGAALAGVTDWGESGNRPGQYLADLDADAAAIAPLLAAGFGVMSEESGAEAVDRPVVVIVDPLDGSTNASLGVPWYATSLCAVDAEGPWVSLVADQARGTRYWAVRGEGAWRDGVAMHRLTRPATPLADAVIGLSGYPAQHLGWRQYRVFGAAALDLCLVAQGTLDAFVDMSYDAHGAWDYLGAMLVCNEVGISVVDAVGRELVTLDHLARRTPVAAAPELLRELLDARRQAFDPS